MSVSELMQAMADAGAPMEAVILAVRALEAKDAELAGRRAAERDRKRKQRERSRDSHGTVTGQSGDTDAQSFPDKVSPQTPLQINPSKSPLNPPQSKGAKALVVQLPERIPAEPWLEFVAMRRAIRNVPFTDAAAKGVIREIEKLMGQGHCPELLLRKAVTRGWRTVFGDEDTKANGSGRSWSTEDRAAYLAKLDGRGTGPPRPVGKIASKIVSGIGSGENA